MDKEKLLSNIKTKYEEYNIEESIVKNYIDEAIKNSKTETECIKNTSIMLDSYIIKSDISLDIIKSNYSYLKKIIKSDSFNTSKLSALATTNKVSIDDKLDEIYNYVIDNIKDGYDNAKLLSQNIIEKIKQNLKKDSNIKIDKNEEFDITFLRKLKGFKIEELSKNTNIAISILYGYINLGKKVPGYNLVPILEYFNVKTYEELKTYTTKRHIVDENKKENQNKYDISFLKSYLLKNKVALVKLQIILSINKAKLGKFLSGEEFINDEFISVLYEIFNVKSYEELKTMVKENTLKIPIKLQPDTYDISFLNKFIILNNIDKVKLSKALDIELTILNDYLNGKKLAPNKIVNKILEIFSLINYYNLINGASSNNINIPIELLKEEIKQVKVDKEDKKDSNESTKNEKENIMQNNIYSNNSIPNILNMIQIDELLKMIDKDKISNSDYLIILLLFGGVENQFFKVDAVSNFLHINKEYVTNIYTKCLKLYKDKLSNEVKKEKKFNIR